MGRGRPALGLSFSEDTIREYLVTFSPDSIGAVRYQMLTASSEATRIGETKEMVSQLRIYTINRGMMESWLKVFEERLRPIHDRLGIPIEATWVNADSTEFIWVRSFESEDVIAQKEAEYFATPERKALGDLPTSHIAKIEVRVIERVLTGAPVT